MAPAMRPPSDGVGFNKKYDTPYAPYTRAQPSSMMLSWTGLRRRRVLLVVVALIALFTFIKNIPSDLVPVGDRYNSRFGSLAPGHVKAQWGLQQMNKGNKKNEPQDAQYEGSILFTELAASLRPHMSWTANQNILFALPDFDSTSNLVPLACQMALHNRSTVHMALLGRQNVNIKDIMSVSGLSAEECPVWWHDARPDHAIESSPDRIQTSIQAGLSHCSTALRPQAMMIDGSVWSTADNGKLLEQVAARYGIPLITLPQDIYHSNWIAALDSASLRELNNVEIDIVIQAHPESTGSLVRLLHSIERADYDGLFYPKITVELPAQVDSFLLGFLERFKWPPGSSPSESRLVLRRRINGSPPEAVEASLQAVELFYPHSASISHVLRLSPDVELSPNYLHYLTFTLLEYRYSQNHFGLSDSLFGISLELPETRLGGSEPFVKQGFPSKTPFLLSQTPGSNAALFMGDKWRELHQFLANRLVHDAALERKPVVDGLSGWLAEVMDLMQARGYYMLYPAFARQGDLKLVTTHQELQQPLQEYAQTEEGSKESSTVDVNNIPQSDILTDRMIAPPANDRPVPLSPSLPLQMLLSSDRGRRERALPQLAEIPLFSLSGQPTDWSESRLDSLKFADDFALRRGGCASLENRDQTKLGAVDYMFCSVR